MAEENEIDIGGKRYRFVNGAPPKDEEKQAPAFARKESSVGNDHITEVDRKFDEKIAKAHFDRLMLFAPAGAEPANLERARKAFEKNLSLERDPDKEEGVRMALRAINRRLLEHSQARAHLEYEPKPKTSLENVRLFSLQRKQPPEVREPKKPPRHGAP